MPFATNDVIEIESSQIRAVARVRNVMGDRIHIALEQGGYLPWTDEPVLVRRLGDSAMLPVQARIIHASGPTAMIELLEPRGRTDALEVGSTSSDRLPHTRDTMTDEA